MESGGRRTRFVAIASGKGGVGKSNVAVNLAVRLSEMGRRVILIDADLGTADADVLCNVSPSLNLAHVVAGRSLLRDILIEAPGGFRLAPGSSGIASMAALSEFERAGLLQQIHQLDTQADVVLFDIGAGVGPAVLEFLAAADQQLIVTTAEPTAITDAYAMIKTLVRHRGDVDVRLLVNMVRDGGEGRAVFERIEAVCQRFLKLRIKYAGHVCHDARVVMAVRRRRPYVLDSPHCEASLCIGQLAHRMERHATTQTRGVGLMRRVAMWLAG